MSEQPPIPAPSPAGPREVRSAEHVLVVDDDRAFREAMCSALHAAGYVTAEAGEGRQALDVFSAHPAALVLLDLRLDRSRLSGMEVLREMAASHPRVPVVMVSGAGSIRVAVEATQLGAYDFLEKPVNRERLLLTVRNALDKARLERERDRLLDEAHRAHQMVGSSAAMQPVFQLIERAARTDCRVLVTGESGVGKELVARNIHHRSGRASGPFVEVNCAAIPSELIESELFGHEKGSFTGAHTRRFGTFERADRGTLFLDEIGDMSASAQAKVLRALQESKITRVGGDRPIEVDVRVVAATNKDLLGEARKGHFREDLYYRLNVLRIYVPPLRERSEDIPALVEYGLLRIRDRGLPARRFTDDALALMAGHPWRGNVRELQNVTERLVVMSDDSTITAAEVAGALAKAEQATEAKAPRAPVLSSETVPLAEALGAYERRTLVQALIANGWKRQETAAALGIDRTHLWRKMQRYGIEEPGGSGASGEGGSGP